MRGLVKRVTLKYLRCLPAVSRFLPMSMNEWLCANCILPQREVLLGMGENTVNEQFKSVLLNLC